MRRNSQGREIGIAFAHPWYLSKPLQCDNFRPLPLQMFNQTIIASTMKTILLSHIASLIHNVKGTCRKLLKLMNETIVI